MALQAYLLSPFTDTNESEMFNRVKAELAKLFAGGEKVVLLGNVSAGSQVDALLIRANSITVIELKNYSGGIEGPENGLWKCSSRSRTVSINEGRENPYLQVKKYRGNVVDKIKRGSDSLGPHRAVDLDDKWIHFVSGLVVFDLITSLTTDVDFVKSKWFRVTDIGGLSDKIPEIGSRAIELTDGEIDIVTNLFLRGGAMKPPQPIVAREENIFNSFQCLKEDGFEGFLKISELFVSCSAIPESQGVYMVLYAQSSRPTFVAKGSGPDYLNVGLQELEKKWVSDTKTVYIGQTGRSLRKRIRHYMRVGLGIDAPHRGGRYIWQIAEHRDLLVCWKTLGNSGDSQDMTYQGSPDDNPDGSREYERKLLGRFKRQYNNKLPFANLIE